MAPRLLEEGHISQTVAGIVGTPEGTAAKVKSGSRTHPQGRPDIPVDS